MTAVTAMALPAAAQPPDTVPPKRAQAHDLWAVLIARIYEVFPLLCSICRVGLRASQAQNQLASSGCTICSIVLAATVQTVEISGFWLPQICTIPGLMRLNFLSVLPT
jgi:hypothetical protein